MLDAKPQDAVRVMVVLNTCLGSDTMPALMVKYQPRLLLLQELAEVLTRTQRKLRSLLPSGTDS